MGSYCEKPLPPPAPPPEAAPSNGPTKFRTMVSSSSSLGAEWMKTQLAELAPVSAFEAIVQEETGLMSELEGVMGR